MQTFDADLFSILGFNISMTIPPGPSPPSPRPIECFRCVLFHLKIFCHQMTWISTEGWLPLIRQQLETMTSRSVLFKKLIHPRRGRKGELFLIFLIAGIAIDLNAGFNGLYVLHFGCIHTQGKPNLVPFAMKHKVFL